MFLLFVTDGVFLLGVNDVIERVSVHLERDRVDVGGLGETERDNEIFPLHDNVLSDLDDDIERLIELTEAVREGVAVRIDRVAVLEPVCVTENVDVCE